MQLAAAAVCALASLNGPSAADIVMQQDHRLMNLDWGRLPDCLGAALAQPAVVAAATAMLEHGVASAAYFTVSQALVQHRSGGGDIKLPQLRPALRHVAKDAAAAATDVQARGGYERVAAAVCYVLALVRPANLGQM